MPASLLYSRSRPRRRSLEALINDEDVTTRTTQQSSVTSSNGMDYADLSAPIPKMMLAGLQRNAAAFTESLSHQNGNIEPNSSSEESSLAADEADDDASESHGDQTNRDDTDGSDDPSEDSSDESDDTTSSVSQEENFLAPPVVSTSTRQNVTLDDIYAELSNILAVLGSIRDRGRPEDESAAVAYGQRAVEAGLSAVSHFATADLQLRPDPRDMFRQRAQHTHDEDVPQLLDESSGHGPGSDPAKEEARDGHLTQSYEDVRSPRRLSMGDVAGKLTYHNPIDEALYGGRVPPDAAFFSCIKCFRHFSSPRNLKIHELHCKRRLPEEEEEAQQSPPTFNSSVELARSPCKHCGRLMTAKALSHHEHVCVKVYGGSRRLSSPSPAGS